jgi:hypothetical protein
MQVCTDNSAFDWIQEGREPSNPRREDGSWDGCFVSNLLPHGFENYVKVLHRLEPKFEDIDHPLDREEIKVLQIPACDQLVSLVSRYRSSDSRLFWRDVASALGIPYVGGISDEWFRKRLQPGCWPRFVYGPGEGYLEDEEYLELASLLSRLSSDFNCYYKVHEIPYIATEVPLHYHGSISEILSIPVPGKWKAPEYWWSSTHDWCICSDYDMSFTLVAGPSRLADSILRSPAFEAIEVSPETRIDYFAPMPVE